MKAFILVMISDFSNLYISISVIPFTRSDGIIDLPFHMKRISPTSSNANLISLENQILRCLTEKYSKEEVMAIPSGIITICCQKCFKNGNTEEFITNVNISPANLKKDEGVSSDDIFRVNCVV